MATAFAREESFGATLELDIACTDFNGDPLDVTSHVVHWRMTRRGAEVLALDSTTNPLQVLKLDATAGQVRIIVTPADQAALAAGVVYGEAIWTVAGDGTVYDQAAGTLHLRAIGIG